MSWTFISAGTPGSSTVNDPTTFAPNLPGTYATGDLLLLFLANRDTTDPIVTEPSGYTLLGIDDAGTYQGGVLIYGKIATSGSETAPDISFSSMSSCQYHMAAFRDSSGVTALGSIVHVLGKADIIGNSNATITYPAATITLDNCLVIIAGRKSKAVDEATTAEAVSGFTEINQLRRSAASAEITVWNYQIQTTATSITESTWTLTTWNESSRDERALTLVLLPTAATKYLKMLAHPSAASASSVAGVVHEAPTGGDITGDKIGEFTGAAFEASLESGQSVLKVAVADFGGSALTTSDVPVALARNATYTTGIVACTVIEE